MSDAEVAEVTYTAFTVKKGQAITVRLIVRRVKDLNRQAAAGQDELFPLGRAQAQNVRVPLRQTLALLTENLLSQTG